MSRRQSLTDENLTTIEKLRVLALELATQPKYKGGLRSLKFSHVWLCQFREKFNLKFFHLSINEKQQILQYADSNPKSGLKEIAEHVSTLFGRPVSVSTVCQTRRNREKLMDKIEEANIKEMFSQDLYAVMSRRHRLTIESSTNAQIRAIALELADDPKYKGYLSRYKFSDLWILNFRKNINLKHTENRT